MRANVVSAPAFFITWIVLLALGLVSFFVSFVHTGPWGMPLALLIAAAKAGLVALFFMELAVQGFTSRLAIAAGVAFFLLLFGLTTADVLTREPPPLRPVPSR